MSTNKQTMKYINKRTNNMYIYKQTTAKAEFNPNSIKNLFNMKTTFKNFFHNLRQNITNLIICMTRRCYLLMLKGPTDYQYKICKQTNKQYVYKYRNNS